MPSDFTLHRHAIKEKAPRVIFPSTVKAPNGEDQLTEKTLLGSWLRVFPRTAKDVFFLQSVPHRVGKFAPADGGGVILDPSYLKKLWTP